MGNRHLPAGGDSKHLRLPKQAVVVPLDASDSTPHSGVKAFVVTSLVLVIAAAATGSVPAVILGVTLALCAAYAQFSAPTSTHSAELRVVPKPVDSPTDARTATADLTLTSGPEGGRAFIEASFPGTRPRIVQVAYRGSRTIRLSAPSVRSGPRESFSVRVMSIGPSGDWFGVWETLTLPSTLIMSPVAPLTAIPSSHSTQGLTGPRTSRRRGDGFEFRDIGPMAWGDSVRRIDWKTSARNSTGTETLYVRRNLAQAESTTFIMLDSRDDVGPEVLSWGSAHEIRSDHRSSLDLAREGATAIAQRAIAQGDRVGFEDISRPRRPLVPATGHRQFMRLQHAIALASPLGAPTDRARAPMVPSGAIVYVLSTFLDDAPLKTVIALVRRGHQVIIVDTLPTVSLWNLSERHTTAFRLIQLTRNARLRTITSLGVPLVVWADHNASQELMQHSRAMAASHGARRGSK